MNYRAIAKKDENDPHVKNAKAMRKDVSVSAELSMRSDVALAIAVQYFDTLVYSGKTVKEAKKIVGDKIQTLVDKKYLPNTVDVYSTIDKYCLKKLQIRNEVISSLVSNDQLVPALEKFSDVSLSTCVKNTCAKLKEVDLPTEQFCALANEYYNEIVDKFEFPVHEKQKFLV